MGIEHSQNYLHSKQLVATLLSKSNICNDDIVIEIGPGKGIITNELAKKSKKVIAIEFDAKLAKTLSEKYKESKKVQIIEMDFLKYKISVKEPYKVCANIPFNITADIVKKVFEADNPPEDIYFIMQYEAFLRYSGQPFYNESLRSLLYKPWFSAELIYEFKPSDFYPVPNARICFAHFQRKTSADVEDAIDYRNFLSYIFLASGNTFKDKTKKLFTYEQQKRICKFLKIKLESTLTEISYDGWLYLYDVFLKFVSNEKKAIILNAEQAMKNNQNKIQKKHRNRNHGYWKFEAKRQKKLKFENRK